MKCTECGNVLTKSVGDHVYRESGMAHVVLRNTATYTCESCGAKRVQIVAMAQLHRALASVLAQKPARLIPSEVRFLRDYLELTNKGFAALMGVTEHQASRWGGTDPMGVPAEHFLRMLTTLGPIALALVSDEPAEVAALKPPTTEALFRSLGDTLKSFPSRSAGATTLQIRAQRVRSDWNAVVQASAN
jgi:DNA-binding transcriptional regulator YiaG